MANATLRMGSRGPAVVALQNALNLALTPSPGLVPDGIFGPKSDRAVQAYQIQRCIKADGIVGPNTHCVLRGVPRRALPTIHHVRRIAQPTAATCWAAATAMMKNSTPKQIIASTPAYLLSPDGTTPNYSDIADNVTGNREFAKVHKLQYHPPQSWSVSGFTNLVLRSPVMVSLLWKAGEYMAGIGSPGHRVIVYGIDSDDDPTGMGTLLHIHDTWKPNVGRTFQKDYFTLVNGTPCLTYGIFTR